MRYAPVLAIISSWKPSTAVSNSKATPAPGTLLLTTTNTLAENTNNSKLERLSGSAHHYEGVLKGEFGLKGLRLPAPQQLILKVGAQVMFVKNGSDVLWVNGTVGIFEKLGDETITVRTETGLWEVEREKMEDSRLRI